MCCLDLLNGLPNWSVICHICHICTGKVFIDGTFVRSELIRQTLEEIS